MYPQKIYTYKTKITKLENKIIIKKKTQLLNIKIYIWFLSSQKKILSFI